MILRYSIPTVCFAEASRVFLFVQAVDIVVNDMSNIFSNIFTVIGEVGASGGENVL